MITLISTGRPTCGMPECSRHEASTVDASDVTSLAYGLCAGHAALVAEGADL